MNILTFGVTNIWVANEDEDHVELIIHTVNEEEDKYEVCEWVEDKEHISMVDTWTKTKVYEGTYVQCHEYLEKRWLEHCRTH